MGADEALVEECVREPTSASTWYAVGGGPATAGDAAVGARRRDQMARLDEPAGMLAGQTPHELPGCLEPPRPEFPSYLDSFAAELARFITAATQPRTA